MTAALQSLPVRFALLAFALAVVIATAIGTFVGWQGNQLLTERALELIRIDAASLNSEFRAGGLVQLTQAIDARAAEGDARRYWLMETAPNDRRHKRLAGNITEMPAFAGRDAIRPSNQGTFAYRLAVSSGNGRTKSEGLAAGLRIDITETLSLFVARDLTDQQSFLRTMQLGLGAGLLGLAALAGLGAWSARSHFAARVEAVTDTARAIMAGNLDQRVPLTGNGDEIDRLSANLNDMLARMAQLMTSLREVSDNIAHDLKTPLNRLRNRAEAALRDPAGGLAYRDGLERTIEEADGLIRTFNALLLIARLEASTVADSMSEIDPATVVADVAELYQPVAEEAGRSLVLKAQTGLRVTANRQLLGQVVSNLVENAIKYGVSSSSATPSTQISLSVQGVPDGVTIVVADHGPGIQEADRERALKRFGRLEDSRTQPGTGLGLSLVAAVARLHGGTLHLEDNEPGLRVVFQLPISVNAAAQHPATV
jgi:signal transduction histidine kinase